MQTPAPDPVLTATGVSFAYGGQRVLDDVAIEISPGEFTALVGPNGAGKSTLLRIMLGLLAPQTGRVELFGSPPRRLRDRWRLRYRPPAPPPRPGPAGNRRGGRRRRAAGPAGMVAAGPGGRSRRGRPRPRVGRPRRPPRAARDAAVGWATAARAHRQGAGVRARAAHPRRADRRGRRAGTAAVPRLACAPAA